MKKKIIIIGAGPAGLTAAYELLDKSEEYEVTVLEETGSFGGISRTVNYKGNHMDMGGHRFFSKVTEVNEWWEQILPTQGVVPKDDKLLGRSSHVNVNGPDPDKEDCVMLRRNRVSRIYFNRKFFDYPVTLKWNTLKNMGFITTIKVVVSYIKSKIFKRQETSLEDFYINRFGRKLYSMFFEFYTENLWGRHPSQISSEWGIQRVKGLSVLVILKDIITKSLHIKDRKVETSLIEEFSYPKYGPGQLWDIVAERVQKKGGKIITNAKVVQIHKGEENMLESVTYLPTEPSGMGGIMQEVGNIAPVTIDADYVISSMPVKDLVAGMNNVPRRYSEIAEGLPYRDYIAVGVLVDKFNLKNHTDIKTIGDITPDNWVYVQDRNVHMGRFQIYNNWSPYLVKEYDSTIWIGLEYFCNEGDSMWLMDDGQFAKFAVKEMIKLGLIDCKENVLDYHVERVKKAYPAYFDTYEHIEELRSYLDCISNLFCVGRNGQHRYNNIDHSMCTSFEAVKNIIKGDTDKSNIWNVNTEKDYHEVNKNEDKL